MATPAFTPLIAAHAVAAGVALVLGGMVFMRPKGTSVHRWMGRAWVAIMTFVAAGSFGIRASGRFSWIHALSIFTLIMLARAIILAKNGRIDHHQRTMQGLYFGALILAGLFTLLPNRLLGNWLWGRFGG